MSFLKSAIQQTAQIASAASMTSAEMSNVKINAGTGDDIVIAKGDYNEILTEAGDDTIVLAGDFNLIFDEAGNNTIASQGNGNKIGTMNGNNDIYSIGDNNEIDVAYGNNRITSKGNDNFIGAVFGNNDIFSEGDGNEIEAEEGNQSVESHGDDNYINVGDGNHDIFATGDRNGIKFGNGNGSTVIFWGTENIIDGGNGDHLVKTLDWAIQQAPNSYYANYADLIDQYAIKHDEITEVRKDIIHEESDWQQVSGSIGDGSTGLTTKGSSTDVTLSTNDLFSMMDSTEKTAIDALNLDMTETFAGSPRYVFAYGSKDKKVHLYDMSTNKSVVSLEKGNNILYTNNEKPVATEGGAGSYVKVSNVVTSNTVMSGKYSDVANRGEDVYAQEIYDGTITTNLVTTTYDFSHITNTVSLGKGNQTVYITGSTPFTGKNPACECGEAGTESTFIQRDGFETNRYERVEDIKKDIRYSTGETLTTGYQGSSTSQNIKTGSPLIVDFNKDGKVSAASGFGVDVDNNGTKDGAAVNGDKMLAMSDMNGNKEIDGTEVFGDQTVNPFTKQKINAKNGFEALKVVAESAYIATGIKCLNNGEVDLRALKLALARVGVNLGFISDDNTSKLEDLAHVASINVENYIQQNQTGDVQHNQLGSYTSTDGNKFKTNDVWFKLR